MKKMVRSQRLDKACLEVLEDRRLLSTVTLDFNGGAGGISNTGFTSVLPTSAGKGLVSGNIALSGGKLLLTTTAGDFWQTRNTQDNALNLAVDATGDFSTEARLTSLPFTKNWQNGGIFIGTNQDNYVKIVAGYNGGQGLQLGSETGAVFTTPALTSMSFSGISTLDFKLVGTAATKTVTALYRINSSDDAAWVTLGSVNNASIFSSSAKAGIVTTNFFATPVVASYESFSVTGPDAPPPPPPPPPPPGETAVTTASLDFNGGAGGINDTGFTGILATSKGKGLISGNVGVSGGKLNLITTAGDAWGTRNTQDDALSVLTDVSARDFTVQTRLTSFPFKANWQNAGLFVGPNEDNYVKLVVGYANGTSLQFGSETAASFTNPGGTSIGLAGAYSLDLRVQGTVANKTLTASYRINSDNDSSWITLGSVANSGVFSSVSRAGIISTNFGTSAMTVAYDSFSLVDGVVIPPPPPPPPPGSGMNVGTNINASKMTGNQLETEIAVNPANPNNVIIVSQNQNNNDAALLISRSTDGGKSWIVSSLGSAQDRLSGSTSRVDPHITFDSFGNAYVVYLVAASSTELRVIIARSSDGGASWTASTAATMNDLGTDFPVIATGPDATNPSRQVVYVGFTHADGKNPDGTNKNRIYVAAARSTGLGNLGAFSAPQKVGDTNGSYASIAVNHLGQVAVVYQTSVGGQRTNNIMLDVDRDGLGTGYAWGNDSTVGSTNVGGFDYIPAQPDRSIDANLKLEFDRAASSSARGRLYLVYTDEDVDESNDTDITFRYTDDLGGSWSSPVVVNDDNTTRSQFLPVMSVDQTNGNVAIVWQDARNDPNNKRVETWGTISTDHGATFAANVKLSAGSSLQNGGNAASANDLDFGDYTGVAYNNGKFIAVWGDNSNSTGDNPNGANSSFDLYTVIVTLA